MTTDLTPPITDDEVAALPLAGARADLLRELLAEADPEAVRRPRRRWPALAAAAAVLALGGALAVTQLGGGDGDGGTPVATDPGPAGPPAFQVRAVSLSSQMPPSDDPERIELDTYVCPSTPTVAEVDVAQIACDDQGIRYLLGPAVVQGGVESAEALVPQGQVSWAVVLDLDEQATADLADLAAQIVGTPTQMALVLDGRVLSAPTVTGALTSGQLQISGDRSRAEAEALAERLAPLGASQAEE